MDTNGLIIMAVMFVGFVTCYKLGAGRGFAQCKRLLLEQVDQMRDANNKIEADKKMLKTAYEELSNGRDKLSEWHGVLCSLQENIDQQLILLEEREENLLTRLGNNKS